MEFVLGCAVGDEAFGMLVEVTIHQAVRPVSSSVVSQDSSRTGSILILWSSEFPHHIPQRENRPENQLRIIFRTEIVSSCAVDAVGNGTRAGCGTSWWSATGDGTRGPMLFVDAFRWRNMSIGRWNMVDWGN